MKCLRCEEIATVEVRQLHPDGRVIRSAYFCEWHQPIDPDKFDFTILDLIGRLKLWCEVSRKWEDPRCEYVYQRLKRECAACGAWRGDHVWFNDVDFKPFVVCQWCYFNNPRAEIRRRIEERLGVRDLWASRS
jgi:hypothetical protein